MIVIKLKVKIVEVELMRLKKDEDATKYVIRKG